MQTALNGSVLDRVVRAVKQATFVGDYRVTGATRLVGDLALGGLGRLKLAMHLEEAFDTELEDGVVDRFITVADIAAYMGKRYFRDVEPTEFA